MKFYLPLILLLIFSAGVSLKAQSYQANAQTAIQLNDAFTSSAQIYDVPVDVLKSVAYAETRMMQIVPEENDDANCMNMPKAYGIMGLRDDNWFGHSLVEGANLIGATVEEVKNNAGLNIKAAAALLSKYAYELNVIGRNNLSSWRPVLEKYSGIPQEDVKPFYSFDIFKVLNEGTKINGVVVNSHKEVDLSQFSENVNPKNKLKNIEKIVSINSPAKALSTDYPPAFWDPSPNFNPNAVAQKFLVVHDTEGSFANSVSWLKNPIAKASSHYIIRSSDGYIIQLVHEKDRAWHVRSWNNVMLGVEHEGYVSDPSFFTEAMYQSSAALFRHFVDTYHVPVDTFRIIGHYQHLKTWWVNWINNTWNPNNPGYTIDPTDNTHTDPGPYWNWSHFFDLISAGGTTPNVTAHTPENSTDSIWATSPITISFDQRMAEAEVENAFKITPQVNGKFTWENDSHTLVFTPLNYYEPATEYNVTLDTTAVSMLNKSIAAPYTFNFYSKPAIALKVSGVYPNVNQTDISTTVNILVYFNVPLVDFNTFRGRVFLYDSTGKPLNVKNASYKEINNSGLLSFSPIKPLDYSANYQIYLKSGIEGVNNDSLESDTVINFTTAADNFEVGSVVDSFMNAANWIQPKQNSNSSNLDTNFTVFLYSSIEKTIGTGSGKLNYTFSDTGGVCSLEPSPHISMGIDSSSKFGIWIFGDLSYNKIMFNFENSLNKTSTINSDTLNWTGWKFIEFPLDSINLSGEIF